MFAYSVASGALESGFVLVTDRFVCLLGADAGAATATELYSVIEADDSHLDDVFDLVVVRRALDRFAVVELLDAASRRFRVGVRGTVLVDLEGAIATRLSGTSTAAWASTEANGVSALQLSLDEPVASLERLPLRHGVVRGTTVSLDHAIEASSVQPTVATQKVATPSVSRQLQPELVEPELAQPEFARPQLAPAARASTVPVETTSTPATIAGWLLTLPDGSEIEARLPIVIGRRPAADEADGVVRVVAPSPNREISASHLELVVVNGELVGRDLDSTNGTVVRANARPPRLLHGGRTTTLHSGDILDVGEAFSVVVSTKN